MLMPHNVGFVPLFSVYLLGSSPGPIAFVANSVCVSHPSDIVLVPEMFKSDDVSSRMARFIRRESCLLKSESPKEGDHFEKKNIFFPIKRTRS